MHILSYLLLIAVMHRYKDKKKENQQNTCLILILSFLSGKRGSNSRP